MTRPPTPPPILVRQLRSSEAPRYRPWVAECYTHGWGWKSSRWQRVMEAADDHLHDHHREDDR